MVKRWRLKKVHAKFLESCRNLGEGRQYLSQASGLRRWILETFCPVPLLALHEDGERLLRALQWLEAHSKKCPVDEKVLRDYHRMIYKGSSECVGEYRKGRISVIGSSIPRPAPEKVSALMKQLEFKLAEHQTNLDSLGQVDELTVLTVAADLYQRVGLVHPFADANGRVARLAMNHILRRYGHGYVIFPPLSEAPELMAALQEAHRGKVDSLATLAKKCLHRI